jgi:hypothetical protein
MITHEENELFALEEEFEQAAADPKLSATARYNAMHAVLDKMHCVVQSGFCASPVLGAHLADLCLDYLAREDLAPHVVKQAFNQNAKAASLHERMLQNEIRRTVTRLSGRMPVLTATR